MRYTLPSARRLLGAALTLLGALFAAPVAAQPRENIVYDGVEIRPGDVINFLGGGAVAASAGATGAVNEVFGTSLPALTYGHTGLYLGVDPEKHVRTFLDYTTDKDRPNMPLPLPSHNPRPFMGRILSEEEFLQANLGSHSAFDVFRLADTSRLESRRLVLEAERISQNRSYGESWWGLSRVCTSAAAEVLSRVTGQNINLISPDSFMNPPFHKLPELANRSIDIRGAIEQARAMNVEEKRSADFARLVPQVAQAQARAERHVVRRLLTAEEFAQLQEQQRIQLLNSYWDYLRALVGYACSNPGDLRTLNDQGRIPGVSLSQATLAMYVAADRGHMSKCESAIFDKILAAGEVAPVADLIAWGQQYRETHGLHVAVKKLFDAIASAGEAISHALSSIGSSGGSSSEGRSSGSSSEGRSSGPSSEARSSDSSSHSSGSPSESRALGQARGIKASGSWGGS